VIIDRYLIYKLNMYTFISSIRHLLCRCD